MILPTWISHEPALWVAIIDALLIVAISFGLPLEPVQKTAIDAVLAALAGVVIRSQVVPVAKLKGA